MKVSLNWLKEYVDLTGISAEEISERLTNSGLEVESIEYQGKQFDNFIVGFVKEKKKHPNADKLSLCVINTGSEDFNVVCGAPNVAAGQKIVFAKIGAVVPDGNFKIVKSKIRGEVSFGMICSEKELGISDDHSGIMVLDPDTTVGMPLADALGLNDVIMELGVTPNRPDALCHIGVARDLATIFDRPFKLPEFTLETSSKNISEEASVEIINNEGCPRYTALVVENVKIKESPQWLKKKLTSIGLRPINNIVDITNFILQEVGQPLHAFDLDKLNGKKIIVQNATEGEPFVTLDSKERKLKSTDLMICDSKKTVAVAGVMGGENSEVTNTTKNVLIESAYFNPSTIRKTAKALQLSTDASYRFERGIDPNNTIFAAKRAASLMAELGEGEILSGIIDVYPKVIEKKEVTLRFSRIEKVLGFDIPKKNVLSILTKLGLEPIEEKVDSVKVVVPTFRPDIEREIDLIEEVARIFGYDKIPTIERISIALEEKIDKSQFRDSLRNAAVAVGFHEIISNSLQPKEISAMFGNPVGIINPENSDIANLRTSMIPGGLLVISHNINVGEKNLNLFEVGNVFNKKIEGEIKSFDDFTEVGKISFFVTGKEIETNWYQKENDVTIYNLKGFIDGFVEKISLDNVLEDSYYLNENFAFRYYYCKKHNNTVIGEGGLIKKDILDRFNINQDVFYFEFDISLLKDVPVKRKSFKELLKYPKVYRDCAFILDKNAVCADVINIIRKGSSKLLKEVKLFDIFESETIGNDKKSMAFSLEYYDENRTLKDDEVEQQFTKMIEFVKKELNAEFRGA